GYARSFFAPSGRRLLAVGVELMNERLLRTPTGAVIELHDLGDPPQVTMDGIAASARVEAQLQRDELPLVCAADGQRVVAATPRRLYWLDRALHIEHVVEGSF